MDRKTRRAVLTLFFLYALVMLSLLFLRTPQSSGGWNLTPFETIRG